MSTLAGTLRATRVWRMASPFDPDLMLIVQRHGVFLRREALGLGYHDQAISRLVRRGDWHRVRHGCFTAGYLWQEADDAARHLIHARAAYRTARAPVALSHVSSLLLHGTAWWDLPLEEAHLTRLDGRTGRREAKVQQHRGLIVPGDLTSSSGVTHSSAARAGLEITTLTDAERALVVVNGLLAGGLTTKEALRERYASMIRWPGTMTTDLVLRRCDPRIGSVGESRLWHVFCMTGLPMPVPQYEVRDRRGVLVALLDFAWPWLGAWAEFDGRVKYQKLLRKGESPTDVVIREKRREELVMELTNWVPRRFLWADLPDRRRCAERISSAFDEAARRRVA